MRSPFVAILALASLCVPSSVNAQAPASLGFQGYLTNASGDPLDSTGVVMTFKLYKGSGAVWSDTHHVDVSNGVFNVSLGKNVPLDTVAFNNAIDLGITVGDDPEISPRTPLAATAYAKALPGLYTFYRDGGGHKSYNVVGGSPGNIVGAGVAGATIGGGGSLVGTTPWPNSVLANFGTVCGGVWNTVNATSGAIGGGTQNTAGKSATISGGEFNSATGWQATIGGGAWNVASGTAATVPGGVHSAAGGEYSLAAGYYARAEHNGSFVWNDYTDADTLVSTDADQFLIGAAGGVGIGVNAPSTALHVYGAGSDIGGVTPFAEVITRVQGPANTAQSIDAPTGFDPLLYFANNGSGIWSLRNDAPSNVFQLRRPGAPTSTIVIEIKREAAESYLRPGLDYTLDLGTSDRRWKAVYAADGVITTSDERLKRDVAPLDYGLDKLMRLNPVRFRWKHRAGERRLGFTAQQVESVLPEVVARPETEDGHYGLNYAELIPVLVKAVQELQAENAHMRAAMARAGIE